VRKGLGWLTALAPIVVVVVLGLLHAHLVGHYAFTGTTRFAWIITFIALLELAAYAAGLPDAPASATGAILASFAAVSGAAVIISVAQLLTGSLLLPRLVVLGASVVLIPTYALLAVVDQRIRLSPSGEQVLAVLDDGEGELFRRDLVVGQERSAQLVDVMTVEDSARSTAAGGGLFQAVEQGQVSVIVLGHRAQLNESVVAQAAELHGHGVRVRTLTLFYDEWLGKLPVGDLERMSLMFDIQELHARRYARMKRMVDVVSAIVGLGLMVFAVPLVILLDMAGNKGSIFFRQTRVGKGGTEFTMVKFRTMAASNAESEWTNENDPRLGAVGRWMRRVHLDELPQSVNLLWGDLSLVGPRPEQPHYVAELRQKIPFYDVRHLVNPGITGWAQVKFHYGASVEDALEKLQYEFFYLRHQGPMLDTRILARTLRQIFRLGGR
jgi:lipopolysaccharide/colanic/teichoic acid biosynthesis glycosyltransferase